MRGHSFLSCHYTLLSIHSPFSSQAVSLSLSFTRERYSIKSNQKTSGPSPLESQDQLLTSKQRRTLKITELNSYLFLYLAFFCTEIIFHSNPLVFPSDKYWTIKEIICLKNDFYPRTEVTIRGRRNKSNIMQTWKKQTLWAVAFTKQQQRISGQQFLRKLEWISLENHLKHTSSL